MQDASAQYVFPSPSLAPSLLISNDAQNGLVNPHPNETPFKFTDWNKQVAVHERWSFPVCCTGQHTL